MTAIRLLREGACVILVLPMAFSPLLTGPLDSVPIVGFACRGIPLLRGAAVPLSSFAVSRS